MPTVDVTRRKYWIALPAIVISLLLLPVIAGGATAPTAEARTGGLGPGGPKVKNFRHSGKPGKAKLLKNGNALPPPDAPRRVVRAIKAANKINKTKYQWGGGHGSFKSRGYDCSGAVSFMLRGAKMLKRPMASGSLMNWGRRGKGKWITVYAHGGHTYAMVAGLRWDTSGGPGPRWHKDKRSKRGFTVRHFRGF